jgi:hypothetical protein
MPSQVTGSLYGLGFASLSTTIRSIGIATALYFFLSWWSAPPKSRPNTEDPTGKRRSLITDRFHPSKVAADIDYIVVGSGWSPLSAPRALVIVPPSARTMGSLAFVPTCVVMCSCVGPAGMSGLTTAAMMSRMGHKVLVLEQHDRCGGGSHTYELGPGYQFDASGSHVFLVRSGRRVLSDHGLMAASICCGTFKRK